MKIGIFIADSNGGYPVPASKGGAVSTLVEHLVKGNNNARLVDMDIISIYDLEAEIMSKVYPNINFIWIKPPKIIQYIDLLCFFIIKKVFKDKKTISYKSIFTLIYYIIKAKKIIRQKEYDKVILENNILLAWLIKLSKYKGNYYYHLHNVPRINAKCKEVFHNATAILCVSEFVAKQIQKDSNAIGPIPSEKIKVLYNCIDTNQFCKVKDEKIITLARNKFGIKYGEKVVIFVGRLSAEKGIDKLLDSVIRLNQKNIKVLIAGSLLYNMNITDEYQNMLHEMSKNLDNQVIFTGYIPQSELPLLYSLADVAVLPSMWDEPAGLTMIEAMACGTPVITTNAGGIPEYVKRYGIILQRNCNLTNNISRYLNKICMDKMVWSTTESSRVDHIRENFSADNYIIEFLKCIGR